MLLLIWTGCSDYAVDDAANAIINSRVNLALNISTSRASTRMSEDVTQVNYATHEAREIQDLKLFPFNVAALSENTSEGKIVDNKQALSGLQYAVNEVESNYFYRHYFDDRSAKIPEWTAAFLCYAKAKPMENLSESVTANSEFNSEFVNGVLTPTGLTAVPNTHDISFTPEQIYKETETVNNEIRPKVNSKASDIADYLTEIAEKIKTAGNDELFYEFINNGYLVAASSTNVPKLKAWVESELNAGSLTLSNTYDDDYPSVIDLPDGAAAVKWNNTSGKFEPQPVTTTEANINRLDRFIFPAELWYYANSRIKTDEDNRKDDYNHADWNDVLATYHTDNGVMGPSVHSVAIKDPLSYAVGCLQLGIVASESLTDANETTDITLLPSTPATNETSATVGTFPLTAVFVSGQYPQKFDFTPQTSADEKIIYDPEIKGITMGDCTSETPNKFVNTLVLQTQDGVDVRFALEFVNNSGDFLGADGIIFEGTKFYLVGTIDVTSGHTEDYRNRAFTKNYITQGTVRISSLKQAYPYLPDLLDPRLEVAVKLVPDWIQSTTTNVPL